MKISDRVKNKYTKETGIILDIWDGKYTVDYYDGEQYNPYRIMVLLDGDNKGSNFKLEHLEPE